MGHQMKIMLCRVCLRGSNNTIDIFAKENEHLHISDVIHKHLGFKAILNDNKGTIICTKCWSIVYNFHEFYETVQNAQTSYVASITICHTNKAFNVTVEANDDRLKESMEIEATLMTDQENPLNDNNDISPSNFIKNTRHNLSENEILHINANKKELPNTNNIYNGDDECLTIWQNKSNRKMFVMQNDKKNQSTMKTLRKRTKCRINDAVYKESLDALIKKHIPMTCSLCVFIGASYSDVVEHYRVCHPKERPHVVCCNLKLSKRCYLTQHALKHENPDSFKCHECQKSFSNISVLRAHNLVHHVPEAEKPYPCETCSLRFATRHLLHSHESTHIPLEERNFFCTECPDRKAFASEYSLHTHRHSAHKKEANICHVCAKRIRDKRCFEKHVRLHYEKSGPRIKCPYPGCESYLKDEDNLKGHLRRHNPEGKIYKCALCEKICKNAKALASHKRYSHSNQTYQCEECGKIFKRAISLKEHVTQHTGEILYNCPFCTRTFNSNANMHAHKKRMHTKEWSEWRKIKLGIS